MINEREAIENVIAKRKEGLSKLSGYRGEIRSKTSIRNLPDVREGEIFWCEMDECGYIVSKVDNGRVEIKALDENASVSTAITVYEFNRSLVEREPLFHWDTGKVNELKENLKKWFEETTKSNEYFLMYGREIHYITLFHHNKNRSIDVDAVLSTIAEAGELISIDFDTEKDQKVIEIWMRTKEFKATMLYLFPYDTGLVHF